LQGNDYRSTQRGKGYRGTRAKSQLNAVNQKGEYMSIELIADLFFLVVGILPWTAYRLFKEKAWQTW